MCRWGRCQVRNPQGSRELETQAGVKSLESTGRFQQGGVMGLRPCKDSTSSRGREWRQGKGAQSQQLPGSGKSGLKGKPFSPLKAKQ